MTLYIIKGNPEIKRRREKIMNYYKIMISDEDGCMYEYVSAKDSTELEAQVLNFTSDFPKHSIEDVTVIEVTVEESLKEEEDRIEHQIFNSYFKRYYSANKVTVREYSNMKKRFRSDADFRWQVLREFTVN